jgi:hypothetical protein
MMSFGGHAVQGRASFLAALDLKSSSGRCNFAAAAFITDLPREISLVCRLLLFKAYETQRRETGDAVVNQMLDSSGMQYAVIAGLRTETGPERLVIAYPNEKSLRDLLAAASIIAVGFSSREAAIAGGTPASPSYEWTAVAIAGRTGRHQQRFPWAKRRTEIASALRRLAEFLVASYNDVATAATVIFSSTNAVSSVIRMALGSSV